jgi:hypothetical protein
MTVEMFLTREDVAEFVLQSAHDTVNSDISRAINRLKRELENWLYCAPPDDGFRNAIEVARQLERVLMVNRLARGKLSRTTQAAMQSLWRGIARTNAPVAVREAFGAVNAAMAAAAQQNDDTCVTQPLVRYESVSVQDSASSLGHDDEADMFATTPLLKVKLHSERPRAPEALTGRSMSNVARIAFSNDVRRNFNTYLPLALLVGITAYLTARLALQMLGES